MAEFDDLENILGITPQNVPKGDSIEAFKNFTLPKSGVEIDTSQAVKLPAPSTENNFKDLEAILNSSPSEVKSVDNTQQVEETSDNFPLNDSPERSVLSAFTGGVQRGWKQTLATIPQLRGIYAEVTGDEEGANQAFAEAQALEAAAPKSQQEFKAINSFEDFTIWGSEKFGEQMPVLAASIAGAGLGAVTTKLALQGLLSSTASRALATQAGAYIGGGVTTIGMETAGIGGELKEATGSFNPGVSLIGGTAAGLLELIVPMQVSKAFFGGKELGRNLLTAAGKTAVLEGATEFSQESIALFARDYADPKFELFTAENGWRLAEATTAGALVGAGIGGVTNIGGGEGRGTERKIDQSEIDGWSQRPISWLRGKYAEWTDPRSSEIREVMKANPDLDALGAGVLLDSVGIAWAKSGVQPEQVDAIGDFIESNTKRYIHPLLGNQILNSTDLEELTALFPPKDNIAKDVKEVNQGSLQPINITANLQELPGELYDPRVFYLPGTTAREKAEIKSNFIQLKELLTIGKGEEAGQLYYNMLNSGFRVIPQYGSSFIYTGQLEGKAVKGMPQSGRSIMLYSPGTKQFYSPGTRVPDDVVGIDLNKVRPGTVSAASTNIDSMLNRLVIPPISTNEQENIENAQKVKQEFAADINRFGTFNQVFAKWMLKGVYVPPQAMDEILIFNPNLDLSRASTTGVIVPEIGTNTINKFSENIIKHKRALNPVRNTQLIDEEIAASGEKSELFKQLEKTWPAIQNILLKLNIPLPQAVSIASIGGMLGLYYTGQQRIQISSNLDPQELLRTLIHEVGHHVTLQSWLKLSQEQQQQIYQAYRRHVVAYRLDKKQLTRHLAFFYEGKAGTSNVNYSLSFSEYLAENFVRWIVHREVGFNQLGDTFKSLSSSLEKLYGETAKNNPNITENFYPDYQFAEWMEWLKAPRDETKPMRRLSERLTIRNNHPIAMQASETLTRELEKLKHLFPDTWNLSVTADTGENIAVTIPAHKVVMFSLAAVEYNAEKVIIHEAVHASRDLFTVTEWKTLVDNITTDIKTITKEWIGHYRAYADKQSLWSKAQKDAYVQDRLDEEGVAIMLSFRAAGVDYKGIIAVLLDKLLHLMTQIARALGVEYGWMDREAIISKFFQGEIAAREQQHLRQQSINNQLEKEDTRPKVAANNTINDEIIEFPEKVKKISSDLWVAEFKTSNVNDVLQLATYRFYTNLDKRYSLQGDVKNQYKLLKAFSTEVGVVYLSLNPKGFEVDYVAVNPKYRRAAKERGEGFATSFYKYIEKDLNQAMKPSGILLSPGYRMWQARDPHQVRYHVYDKEDAVWYSPNYIVTSINFAKGPKAKAKWETLKQQVNPTAWLDPDLEKMFHIHTKGMMYGTGLAMAEQERQFEETTITGNPSPGLGFEDIMATRMQTSQAENERILKLEEGLGAPAQPEFLPMRNILKSKALTPAQKNMLRGVVNEADRIGWFSKKWWGIHQLAWSNPHIAQLRSYLTIIERWAAKVEFWVNKADETARDWEKTLPLEERGRLADLLFYMTEMEYRTPQEQQQKVIRRPTQQEISAAFQKFRISPTGQQIYIRIESNFAEFLQEIERISASAIEREFIGQRVNGVPSQAEIKAKAELVAEMTALRSKPYFPMMRFGEWTLTIRDPNTNQVTGFYTFESQKERNDAIIPLGRQNKGMDISVGRMSEEVMEFVGIPGPLLRRIKGNLPGITAQQEHWLDQLTNQLSPERSFRKRFMHRKGTAGYSLDAFRVFANYFQTGAKYIARLEFKDQAQAEIDDLRKTAPTLFKDTAKRIEISSFMQQHLKYMQEGGRDWAKLKSFIAIWHLGYSPMAAMLNLTQIPMVTMPYLSSMFGNRATLRALYGAHSALKTSFGGTWNAAPWPGYEKGRQELIQQGKIDAGQAPELAAYASANNLYKTASGQGAAKFLRTVAKHSMWMFSKAERINRELTYHMAFSMAMRDTNARLPREIQQNRMFDISDLMNRLQVTYDEAVAILAAREAIDRTHGIYAPWARPVFMRQPLAGTILTFFTYTQMMLYALRNNPGAWKHMMMLLAVAGMMGLPGADDLDRLVEAVARKIFGKDWSPKNEARKYINIILEGSPYKTIGSDIFLHGISRYGFGVGLLPEGIGAPRFDASGNMSMGKIIPGVGEGLTAWGSNQEFSKVMAQTTQGAAGAGFGVMFNLLQYLSASADPGNFEWKKWEKALPRSVKAMSKSIRYGVEGKETFKSGATFETFDVRDPDDMATLVAQFLGATPLKLNQKWQANAEITEKLNFWRGEKRILYEQMIKTIQTNDTVARNEVIKSIKQFNLTVRNAGVPSLGIDTAKLRNSLQNRTRVKQRQELNLPASSGEIPAVRSMQELYPEVKWQKVK